MDEQNLNCSLYTINTIIISSVVFPVSVMYLLSYVLYHAFLCMYDVILMSRIFRPSARVHCSVYPHVLSINVSLSLSL